MSAAGSIETAPTLYDSVLCVGPHHREIAVKAIRSLLLFTASRMIFVVTAREHFSFFERFFEPGLPVQLLDEDEVIEGVTLSAIRSYLTSRKASGARAGWYLQQFLKMSICRHPDVAGHYLIWDSDTIALRKLTFFDWQGKTFVNPRTEHLKPYFRLIRATLGIERQVRFSFISEHLMVNKAYMLELLGELSGHSADGRAWPWRILDSIDDRHLSGSGFSEYETYGNFVAARHRDSFLCRPLKSTRHGTFRFGTAPDKHAIHYYMSSGHSFATFETNTPKWKWLIALNRTLARAHYSCWSLVSRLSDRERRRLAAAAELCRPSASAA
jgi:hypothetical protein